MRRKIKVLRVPSRTLIAMMTAFMNGQTLVVDLPEGTEVLACSADFCQDEVLFRLYNESWPELNDGDVVPCLDATIAMAKRETKFREFL